MIGDSFCNCECEDGSELVVPIELLRMISPSVIGVMFESNDNKEAPQITAKKLHTDGSLIPTIKVPIPSKEVLKFATEGVSHKSIMDSLLFLHAQNAPSVFIWEKISNFQPRTIATCLVTCEDPDRAWFAILSANMDIRYLALCLINIINLGDRYRYTRAN